MKDGGGTCHAGNVSLPIDAENIKRTKTGLSRLCWAPFVPERPRDDSRYFSPSPGQLFLEPLIWLELAESRCPELSDLRLARPIIVGRRCQGQRPAHRNHHDRAHALCERTSEMAKQRFEGAVLALDHCRGAGETVALAHKGIDEVDFNARV